MTHEIKEAGWKYLLLSLGIFLGIALEGVHAYGWEPIVFGADSFRDYTTRQSVLHWIITCLTWIAAAYLLIRIAKNKLGFHIWKKGETMKPWQLIQRFHKVYISIYLLYG